jgi:hypothetical protein
MWRSKLGTDYPKDFMDKNETRLLKEVQSVKDLPENRTCADCGTRGTNWASVNLGVFLCMTCGSHHRSLGTHISLPKGCSGTYLWGPDEIDRMRAIGNARARELYGDAPPRGVTNDDVTRWKEYLTDKYVHKKFASESAGTAGPARPSALPSASSTSPPGASLHRASPTTGKATKFAKKMMMPDVDLIHFEDDVASRSPGSPQSTLATTNRNVPPAATGSPSSGAGNGKNFFAEFGL